MAISDFQAVPVLRLNDGAHDLFLEWRRVLERRLRSDDDMTPALESHLAKYRKLVPALALINHLADIGKGNVGEKAMQRALAMATYLETHARRVYGAGSEAETAAAKAILLHIRREELKDGFSARDVYRNHWSKLTERSLVHAGLELLRDHNWLAEMETDRSGGQGGRPSVQYLINPGAFQ